MYPPYDHATTTGRSRSGLLDHRRHVVRPELAVRVVLGARGLLGQTVAANVEGDDPKPRSEIAADLLRPAEVALRPAVHEEKRGPLGIAPLPRVEPDPSAAPISCVAIGWPADQSSVSVRLSSISYSSVIKAGDPALLRPYGDAIAPTSVPPPNFRSAAWRPARSRAGLSGEARRLRQLREARRGGGARRPFRRPRASRRCWRGAARRCAR